MDSPLTPAFELQSFVTETLTAKPHESYINLLYIYPLGLNYGGQKAFSKARNIACNISFASGKTHERKKVLNDLKLTTFQVRVNF